MNFELSEEQQAMQTMAHDFAHKALAPHAAQWDRDCFFPEATLRKAAGLGLAGIYVREDVGGSDLTRFDAALIFEALAQGCPSTAAYLSIHNMATGMIDRFGTEALRRKFCPPLTRMDCFISYCLTEPGSGSDAASLTTKAVRHDDYYHVTGSKAFISGGGRAEVYVVMVRTGEPGPGGISTLVIEKDTPGVHFGPQEKKLGWHSQPTCMVMFEDCRVPVSNRLGAEGDGFKIAMQSLDGGRLNIGACSLGAAQACLDMAVAYMAERQQFGRPLNQFQALQFRLADMKTELEAARLLLYKAATMVEAKAVDATAFAAMAKRLATDTGFRVVNEALQLHGGYGYIQDYPIERYLRDVRVHQILEGSNEIMRLIIARHMIENAASL